MHNNATKNNLAIGKVAQLTEGGMHRRGRKGKILGYVLRHKA